MTEKERLIDLLTDNLNKCDNPLQMCSDEQVERLAEHLLNNGVSLSPVVLTVDCTPIVVKMPYGDVEIHTREEAVRFVKNKCNNCQYSNEMNKCSGHQANSCETQVKFLLEHFKKL